MLNRNQISELMVKNNQFGIGTVMKAKAVKETLGIDQKELKELVKAGLIRVRSELSGGTWYSL